MRTEKWVIFYRRRLSFVCMHLGQHASLEDYFASFPAIPPTIPLFLAFPGFRTGVKGKGCPHGQDYRHREELWSVHVVVICEQTGARNLQSFDYLWLPSYLVISLKFIVRVFNKAPVPLPLPVCLVHYL